MNLSSDGGVHWSTRCFRRPMDGRSLGFLQHCSLTLCRSPRQNICKVSTQATVLTLLLLLPSKGSTAGEKPSWPTTASI